jgi:hypothetical protein
MDVLILTVSTKAKNMKKNITYLYTNSTRKINGLKLKCILTGYGVKYGC